MRHFLLTLSRYRTCCAGRDLLLREKTMIFLETLRELPEGMIFSAGRIPRLTYSRMMPRRVAIATASVRSFAPSLSMMCLR